MPLVLPCLPLQYHRTCRHDQLGHSFLWEIVWDEVCHLSSCLLLWRCLNIVELWVLHRCKQGVESVHQRQTTCCEIEGALDGQQSVDPHIELLSLRWMSCRWYWQECCKVQVMLKMQFLLLLAVFLKSVSQTLVVCLRRWGHCKSDWEPRHYWFSGLMVVHYQLNYKGQQIKIWLHFQHLLFQWKCGVPMQIAMRISISVTSTMMHTQTPITIL